MLNFHLKRIFIINLDEFLYNFACAGVRLRDLHLRVDLQWVRRQGLRHGHVLVPPRRGRIPGQAEAQHREEAAQATLQVGK